MTSDNKDYYIDISEFIADEEEENECIPSFVSLFLTLFAAYPIYQKLYFMSMGNTQDAMTCHVEPAYYYVTSTCIPTILLYISIMYLINVRDKHVCLTGLAVCALIINILVIIIIIFITWKKYDILWVNLTKDFFIDQADCSGDDKYSIYHNLFKVFDFDRVVIALLLLVCAGGLLVFLACYFISKIKNRQLF